MQPMTHERLQAFLERNQKLVSTPKSSNQLEHKHSSSSSSAISTSDAKGKTDNLKDKRSVSPIHARDLSNINSDQRGNSDSFLSSDKDLQPFINYKSPTVNLIPEIDYLYSYATNNNTTLKSPLKISDNNERDNFFRDQEYYSAQKSPFKKDNLFDFKSNPEVVKTSSRSVSPRSQSNSKKDNLSNRLEAYLVSKKKFQDKLKENYTKDLKAKSAVKVQTANTPKSSLNSSSSKIFKKQRSPLKTAPFSIAVPNYAKPTESKKSKESRGNSPEFPLKSRSITPSKSKSKIEFYFYEESSSNSKIKTDRTPKKKEDLSRSRSGILKNATPSKTPDKLVQEKTIPDKGSTKKKVKLEDDNLFGASSRKLQDIDESLDKDSIYKKEIKNLIKTIKEEKEQVSKDLLTMAAQLAKYKHKYKKMKKIVKEKKSKNNSDDQNEEKSDKSEEMKPSKKSENDLSKKSEEINVFTIEDLKVSNKSPKKQAVEKPTIQSDELIKTCENLNQKVESIMNGNKFEYQSGASEAHTFELPKTPEISYLIKDMNLDMRVFFSDPSNIERNPSVPKDKDINLASRKIIQFLYEKLQFEQYQRLRTEEQANDMILNMQKTINQLEEKRIPIRK